MLSARIVSITTTGNLLLPPASLPSTGNQRHFYDDTHVHRAGGIAAIITSTASDRDACRTIVTYRGDESVNRAIGGSGCEIWWENGGGNARVDSRQHSRGLMGFEYGSTCGSWAPWCIRDWVLVSVSFRTSRLKTRGAWVWPPRYCPRRRRETNP